jgi:uncharacterized protein YndB with AHSA1/START domain
VDVPDSIKKELTLSAPRDRVWRALTEPDQLVRWFPTQAAEVDLRAGGSVRFRWEGSSDEGVIDDVSPNERLVFRWRAEGSSRPYTRVAITLEDLDGGGTRLVLTEDGFSAFGDDERGDMVAGNDRGWGEELEELAAFVQTPAA